VTLQNKQQHTPDSEKLQKSIYDAMHINSMKYTLTHTVVDLAWQKGSVVEGQLSIIFIE